MSEKELLKLKKLLSDELALFIKRWSFKEYGKRYIGLKDSRLRYEGVVIDLEQRIRKVLSIIKDKNEVVQEEDK